MAKINIEFDGKIYSVDETTLAPLASPLERALIQQLAGTGAVIRLGGTNYNVDANKLASARNVLTNQLGNIAGTDSKVTVNGAEYGLSKTKLQGATDKMHDVLSGLGVSAILPGVYEPGSNYTVMKKSWAELLDTCVTVENGALKRKIKAPDNLPEKNEYGFYYGVKYYLNYMEYNEYNSYGAYCFFENGQYEYSSYAGRRQAPYECDGNTIKIFVYEMDSNDVTYLKEDCTLMISSDGLRLVKGPGLNDEYSCGEDIGFAYSKDYAGEVVLPNDGSITCIDNAFIGGYDSEHISGSGVITIIVPDSVQEIKEGAFTNGYDLIDIYINKPEDSIPGATWYAPYAIVHWNSSGPAEQDISNGTKNLRYTLNEDGESYAVTGLGTCRDSEIIIPDTYNGLPITVVGSRLFSHEHAENITSVIMSDNIKVIEDWALGHLDNATRIEIGAGIETIGFDAIRRGMYYPHLDLYIHKPKGSVPGAPWTGYGGTDMTIHWTDATVEYEYHEEV